jgi:hypothetical protein
LVDEQGRIRGGLGFDDTDQPALVLVDEREGALLPRAALQLTKEGPGLVLADANGVHRVTIGTRAATSIMLNDAKGRPRLLIGLDEGDVIRASAIDPTGEAFPVAFRPGTKADPEALDQRLRPLAEAGDEASFTAALVKELSILDRALLTDLWRVAQEALKLERAAGDEETQP